tara:strand:+ start:1048 stop:1335 length:288 start_codon:yes stop_codon:yes gene_type:complete
MKISKERLKQIIQEEMKIAEEENEQEEATKTLAEFSKKFYDLAKQVRGVKGLDAKEMQMIMDITLSLIKGSAAGTLGPKLEQIQAIISKRLGDNK